MVRALAACVRANVPLLLWGSPGVGKTAVLTACAKAWDRHLETVIGSIREASDFLGLPVEVDGEVRYSPPAWARRLADAPSGLLYLGELTTSTPSVQKAALRLVQERVAGELALPDTVAIVADCNPVDQAVDGWELAPPVANRFIHLQWDFDHQHWLTGLVVGFDNLDPQDLSTGLVDDPERRRVVVAARVSTFLRTRPDLIAPGPPSDGHGSVDPQKAGQAWPSPRSWTNTVEALSQLRDDDQEAELLILKGGVGEGAARDLLAWQDAGDLIDPWDAMRDPASVPWRSARPDQLYVLAHSVAAAAIASGEYRSWIAGLDVMVEGALHGRPDVVLPAVQALLNRADHVRRGVPARVREAFGPLLVRAGVIAEAVA
jgi:MoxR-like ATPase